MQEYRHTLEILQVWFQTTAIKQISQSELHKKIILIPSAYKSYVYTIL